MGLYDVLIKIGGDSSPYKKELNRLQLYNKKATQTITKAWKFAATNIVGILGVAFGVRGLYRLFNNMIEKSIEQEEVEKRLASVIESTGQAAGYTSQELYQMAADLQKLTTIGDETVIAGQAILATFKEIKGDEFKRATSAALDMSEVMQQDLKTSIVMIGKALNDPVGNLSAMTRAGVQFTDSQETMIKKLWKAGDTIGAQQIILKELESQFGGAAAAAKDTFGGALDSLNNAWGDYLERTGDAITKSEIFIDAIHDAEKAIYGLTGTTNILAAALEGAFIYFGVGEKNELRKQLIEVVDDLNKVEYTITRLKGVQAWQAEHPYRLSDRKKTAEKLAEAEAELLVLDAKRREITQKLYDLHNPPATTTAGSPVNESAVSLDGINPLPSKEAEFDHEKVMQIIEDQLEEEREAYAAVMEKKNAILQEELAAVAAANAEREALEEDLTDRIMQLTLEEKDYKIWALNKEVEAMRETAGAEKETLDQIESYYDASMAQINKTTEKTFGEEMQNAMTGWASNFSGELNEILWDSEATFGDIAKAFGKMLTQMMIQKNIAEPVLAGIGSLFVASAKGNVFAGEGISAYENQVITRPTLFPFARGVGLTGEAGYEGILPLTRTRSGDLGVRAEGGGGTIVEQHFHVTGNQVWDQASMEALVTNISARVAYEVTPDAWQKNYDTDGVVRETVRNAY